VSSRLFLVVLSTLLVIVSCIFYEWPTVLYHRLFTYTGDKVFIFVVWNDGSCRQQKFSCNVGFVFHKIFT
jgi:hypothetical protein